MIPLAVVLSVLAAFDVVGFGAVVGAVVVISGLLVAAILGLRGNTLKQTNEMLDTAVLQERRERKEQEEQFRRDLDASDKRCASELAERDRSIARLEGRLDAVTGDFAKQIVAEVRRELRNGG